MKSINRQSRISRVRALVLVCLFLALLVGLIHQHYSPKSTESAPYVELKPIEPKVISIESKNLFFGNSFWGRYTDQAAMKTVEPYKFPFSKLDSLKRENYDGWLTGLECPTTTKGVGISASEMDETLSFNCNPAYLSEYSKWFTAVTLANNHTDNMGADGFEETKQALSEYGIQYFGHYDPEKTDELCKVIALPARAQLDNGSIKLVDLPVAMCGYHGVFKIPSEESIAQIARYAKVLPVIVLPHAGAEYKASPDQIKTTMYHSMIDAGADMVLGDHPHWIQNTETYKGKLIAYSMGNFMFDQQFSQEVTRSAAISVEISLKSLTAQDYQMVIDFGKLCLGTKSNCLDSVSNQGKLYQPSYLFDFVPTDNKGYQSHYAPEQHDQIASRLNWSQTMKQLGQN